MTRLVIMVVAIIFYCIGAMIGKSAEKFARSEYIEELIKKIDWWKNQAHEILNEVNEWKDKYSEMQHMYNKERNKVFECEQNLEAYIQWKKVKYKTIADRNKENIISLFNEWLTDREIAEVIGCGRSTIQRAVKKFWLR